MESISAIIPSYNSSATISHTLKSLIDRPDPLLREVIVVDSSNDGWTPALLDACDSKKVRVIHLDQKTMPAKARNLGARQASGEILAFIDSDAYASEDWLGGIAAAVRDGHRVGGGSIALPPFQKRKWLAVAQFFLQFNEHVPAGKRRVKPYVPSCNLFCERELFEKIGGFPQVRASEDVLFGLKTGKITPIIFDPAVRVYHIFRENWTAYLDNQRMLGEYIFVYRNAYFRRFIYKPLVAVLLSPLFAGYKFVKLNVTMLKTRKIDLLAPFFVSLPILILGLIYWWAGFVGACFKKRSDEYAVIGEYA